MAREMVVSALEPRSVAPRVTLLLPVTYLLHLAEEWFGGFVSWSGAVLGTAITVERFVVINAVGFVMFASGTAAALRFPRMAWFGTSFAALVGVNGVLHTLATLALGRYSPGTVTGLLLYLPVSALVLRASAARLPRTVFAASVAFGVLLHGFATWVALL